MDNSTQPAEVTEQVKGTTKFGFDQTGLPTPKWASTVFTIILYVATLGTLAVSIFTTMPDAQKVHICEICSFVTLAVHQASKMFGIQLPQDNK